MSFTDLKFHIHADVFNLGYFIEEGFEKVNTFLRDREELLVALNVFHNCLEGALSDICKDLSKALPPLIDLFQSVGVHFSVININDGVLVVGGFHLDVLFLKFLQDEQATLNQRD